MDYYKESLKMHEEHKGKMAVASKVKVETKDDLSTAYTPGVAEPCRKIKEDPENVYKYTNKSNIVAVVSDGSAVPGPWEHRRPGVHSGHGWQISAVQGIRGHRRIP